MVNDTLISNYLFHQLKVMCYAFIYRIPDSIGTLCSGYEWFEGFVKHVGCTDDDVSKRVKVIVQLEGSLYLLIVPANLKSAITWH